MKINSTNVGWVFDHVFVPFYQDLYVDRLVERVDRLKEEIAMFEAQITAQAEETKINRDALMEANMEIEVSLAFSF